MVESYSDLYDNFRWHVPKGFNLASVCCLQWSSLPSHEHRPALIHHDIDGQTRGVTFAELGRLAAQLANGLIRLGVIPGDRVVIVLSSPIDALTALMACWAVRAVAVPLSPGSNADALLPRVKQARGQVALIDDRTQSEALAAIARCPRIKHTVGIDVYDGRVMNWRGLIARQPTTFVPIQPLPSDPALMVWPEHPSPDLAAQSAMVLAHQSLIGQLPGFVMATNWFPEKARQLLTTLKPWDESGLLAAILPALYFGHTVVLTDQLPTPDRLPVHVSHVVTHAADVIAALKSDPAVPPITAPLAGLALLDHTLHRQWRQDISLAYGVTPNLVTFVNGCGLLISQSAAKWPDPETSSGRLVPGHCVRLKGMTDEASEMEVSRTDLAQQTDPAQFTQAWPVKDALDLSTELPAWWRTGLFAQVLEDGCWRVLGYDGQWQPFGGNSVSVSALEQAVLLAPQIKWVQVAFVPGRKAQGDSLELWALIDTGPEQETQMKAWRQTLRMDITNRILDVIGSPTAGFTVRIGLVNQQAIPMADPQSRWPWQSRAYQALIDFL